MVKKGHEREGGLHEDGWRRSKSGKTQFNYWTSIGIPAGKKANETILTGGEELQLALKNPGNWRHKKNKLR